MAGYRVSEFESDSEIAELCLEDLERTARATAGGPALPLRDWIALAESWRIARALREARGNRSAAARALGIGRRTLYAKMDKLGVVSSWGITREGRLPDATCPAIASHRTSGPSHSRPGPAALPQD
jgi:hypothetical protein